MPRPRLGPAYGPTALRTPANALTLMRLAITPVVLGLILISFRAEDVP